MAMTRGFRRLAAACIAVAAFCAISSVLLFFVLMPYPACVLAVAAILLGIGAWVSRGFALPDE